MNEDKQSQRDAERKKKLAEEETLRLVKEQERRKAYLDKEQALEKAAHAREIEQAKKRAVEEISRVATEQARKAALAAREKQLAESQKDRKLKDRNNR